MDQQVGLLTTPKLNRNRKPKLDGLIRCKSMPFVIQFDSCCVMLLVFLLRAEYLARLRPPADGSRTYGMSSNPSPALLECTSVVAQYGVLTRIERS